MAHICIDGEMRSPDDTFYIGGKYVRYGDIPDRPCGMGMVRSTDDDRKFVNADDFLRRKLWKYRFSFYSWNKKRVVETVKDCASIDYYLDLVNGYIWFKTDRDYEFYKLANPALFERIAAMEAWDKEWGWLSQI